MRFQLERVHDQQAVKDLASLEVLGQQVAAARRTSGSHDERIPVAQLEA